MLPPMAMTSPLFPSVGLKPFPDMGWRSVLVGHMLLSVLSSGDSTMSTGQSGDGGATAVAAEKRGGLRAWRRSCRRAEEPAATEAAPNADDSF